MTGYARCALYQAFPIQDQRSLRKSVFGALCSMRWRRACDEKLRIPVVSLAPWDIGMLTTASNEPALKQYWTDDGKRVLSIVPSGRLFRFVVEQLTHEPASPGVGACDYWEEAYRSGLYETADMAEEEALTANQWAGRNDPNNR